MNTSPSSAPHSPTPTAGERALVLGGGGSTGHAWLIGVLAGLGDAGLDVTDADLIVGTSAGATVAAQITNISPARLFAETLAAASPTPTSPARPADTDSTPVQGGPVADRLRRMREIVAASDGPLDLRRRLAAAALELDAASDGSGHARWRAVVAARLPGMDWPQQRVLLTAVDALSAEPVEFDRHSGVDLVDAVAASTAGGPPYRIGERLYIDGYRRSSENADLATGYERVLVLSPLGGRSWAPPEWGMHLAAQVEELRGAGSRVETILPSSDSEHLFGAHAMDQALRPAAARAGHDHGTTLAEHLTAFWR